MINYAIFIPTIRQLNDLNRTGWSSILLLFHDLYLLRVLMALMTMVCLPNLPVLIIWNGDFIDGTDCNNHHHFNQCSKNVFLIYKLIE